MGTARHDDRGTSRRRAGSGTGTTTAISSRCRLGCSRTRPTCSGVPDATRSSIAWRGEAFGEAGRPAVRAAWAAFSEAIRAFPYSDARRPIARPIPEGAQPPALARPGPSRTCRAGGRGRTTSPGRSPGDPRSLGAHLRAGPGWVPRRASTELEAAARKPSSDPFRAALEGEWRIARTIEASLTTVLHLLAWIPLRDAFVRGHASPAERRRLGTPPARHRPCGARRTRSRSCRSSSGTRGLDSPPTAAASSAAACSRRRLVRWKIGQLDDLLLRELPDVLRGLVDRAHRGSTG